MAIYHCSVRCFSRSDGHSAVAAAAYRSGQDLTDTRTGKLHRYGNRRGVQSRQILMPEDAPSSFFDRTLLWNAAEEAETRKNARVAREAILALPHELTPEQRAALTRDMALYLVEKYRVAVDAAIHAPLNEPSHDPRNHHAHLLFTTRMVTPEGLGFKTRVLDDRVQGPIEIERIREVWEALANDALVRAGHTDITIDRRTLEDQGVDRVPQTHVGNASTWQDDEVLLRKKDEQDQKAKRVTEERTEELESDGRDDEGDQDEDEGEGDRDSQTGKTGGSGDKALAPAAIKTEEQQDLYLEDRTSPNLDYTRIDKGLTRAAFNDQIKQLNKERAQFAPKPLAQQISEIEREVGYLDRRVERLSGLLVKTTVPRRLQRLVGQVVARANSLLQVRQDRQEKVALTEAERQFQRDRRVARYGRPYRTGLHEKIADMREKITTLQTLDDQYRKYSRFVVMIETELIKVKVRGGQGSAAALEITKPILPETGKGVGFRKEQTSTKADQGSSLGGRGSAPSAQEVSVKKTAPGEDTKTGLSALKQAGLAQLLLPGQPILIPPLTVPEKVVSLIDQVGFGSRQLDLKTAWARTQEGSFRSVQSVVDPEQQGRVAGTTSLDRSEKVMALSESNLPAKLQEKTEVVALISQPVSLSQRFKAATTQKPPVTPQAMTEKIRAEAEVKRAAIPTQYRGQPYSVREDRSSGINSGLDKINSFVPVKVTPDPGTNLPATNKRTLNLRKNWDQATGKETQSAHVPKPVPQRPQKTMSSKFNNVAGKSNSHKNKPNLEEENTPSMD